jgi:hypothetical protein
MWVAFTSEDKVILFTWRLHMNQVKALRRFYGPQRMTFNTLRSLWVRGIVSTPFPKGAKSNARRH